MDFKWEIFLNLFRAVFDKFAEELAKLVANLVRHFPNVVSMVDDILNFLTGLPGILVGAPFVALQTAVVDRLGKLPKRLITVDKAIDLAFQAHAEIARNLTFTDNVGLAGLLATIAGKFVWATAKRVKLLAALLRAKSEAEVVAVIFRTITRKLNRLKIGSAILGILVAVEWFGFLLWTMGLILLTIEGGLVERILPQDSKRMYVRFSGTKQVRVNVKPGPDS